MVKTTKKSSLLVPKMKTKPNFGRSLLLNKLPVSQILQDVLACQTIHVQITTSKIFTYICQNVCRVFIIRLKLRCRITTTITQHYATNCQEITFYTFNIAQCTLDVTENCNSIRRMMLTVLTDELTCTNAAVHTVQWN